MRHQDRGDTLVELVVALAVLGTAVITVLGGFLNLTSATALQKQQARMLSGLVSASEYAKTRPCRAACAAEPDVLTADVPQSDDAVISITGPSTAACCAAPLVQYTVTVSSGGATFSNVVVVRP